MPFEALQFDFLQYDFFRHALFAGLLASIACGIVGTFVVVKRTTSIAGGLSHAAFGGLGLGYLLNFSPMLGAGIFALIGALVIGFVSRRQQESLDTLVSILWAVGMALGILFLSMAKGPVPDLNSYLFGSILFVPQEYLYFVGALDLAIVVAVGALFKELQAISFDEEFSEAAGLPVDRLFLLLLALTSVSIVMLIRVVGVILLIALLAMPAAIARQWSRTLREMMFFATGICAVVTTGGLVLSWNLSSTYSANVPSGPLVILLAALLFAVSSVLRRFV